MANQSTQPKATKNKKVTSQTKAKKNVNTTASSKAKSKKPAKRNASSRKSSVKKSNKFLVPVLVGGACAVAIFAATAFGNAAKDPGMTLESNVSEVTVGEPFAVDVYADSASVPVNAVGVLVNFDSSKVDITKISTEDSVYTVKAVENEEGDTLELVRAIIGETEGKRLVGEVTFVVSEPGSYTFSFDPSRSNLVDSENNKNILENAQYKNLTVEAK